MKNLSETEAGSVAAGENAILAAMISGVSDSFVPDRDVHHAQVQAILAKRRETLVDAANLALREALLQGKQWAFRLWLERMNPSHGNAKHDYSIVRPEARSDDADLSLDLKRLSQEQLAHVERAFANSLDDANIGTPEQAAKPSSKPVDDVVAAIAEFKGHLTLAAAKLGMTRSALVAIIARSPEAQAAVNRERTDLVDRAEAVLCLAIRDRAPWAVRFVLETLGRSRG